MASYSNQHNTAAPTPTEHTDHASAGHLAVKKQELQVRLAALRGETNNQSIEHMMTNVSLTSMPQQPNSNGQNVSPQLQYNQASPPSMQFPYPMQPASKLFVGGLAGTVSNNDFFAYFAAYGQVVDSVVMIDKET